MKKLVAAHPDNDRYQFTLGALYDENRQKDRSVVHMTRAIEINPKNAAALNYLGYTYAEQGVRLDEAENLIRRALAISPHDGYYIDSLGWVYYQRGEYDKAIEQLEHAVSLADDDPTIAEHLADAYSRPGAPTEALRVYRDALGRTKDTDQAARIRAKIEELQGAPLRRGDS